MQSEAYGYALRDWKRKFGGRGRELCAGAIIWQLNDVYPATSWAYVDYYRRPKPAFYTIRRAFAPISLGIDRTPRTAWVDEDRTELSSQPPRFNIFAHNTRRTSSTLTLEVSIYDFNSQKYLDLKANEARTEVFLAAGCNTELTSILPTDLPSTAQLIICAKLLNSAGTTVARHISWPEPYRYLIWPPSTGVSHIIRKSTREAWEHEVEVSANVPVKGYWLEQMSMPTRGKEPTWEDNMLDVMPGETVIVGVNGLDGSKLQARFLADWEIEGVASKL
jgi:beta-mannosidase